MKKSRVTISRNFGGPGSKGENADEVDGPSLVDRVVRRPMNEPTSLETPATRIHVRVDVWSVRYGLTRREAELLFKAALGESLEQMTSSFRIRTSTIRKHRENLLRK